MRDEIKRLALFTSGVVELTRYRAEKLVKDMVSGGDLGRDQASGLVKELVRRSAENRKELVAFVRGEIRHQIEGLGLATKRDVERLERRVARLETAKKTPAKSTRKRSAAKKTPGKKATKGSSN